MFLSGDEFCNTQYGNNNAYCQDNEISWLDWSRLEQYRTFQQFVARLIAFRKEHPVLRGKTAPARCGWPDLSLHNGTAWNRETDPFTRQIGVLFAGRQKGGQKDDLVLLAVNAHWEPHRQELPEAPNGCGWRLKLHTFCEDSFQPDTPFDGKSMMIGPRSAAVFVAE